MFSSKIDGDSLIDAFCNNSWVDILFKQLWVPTYAMRDHVTFEATSIFGLFEPHDPIFNYRFQINLNYAEAIKYLLFNNFELSFCFVSYEFESRVNWTLFWYWPFR